MKTKKVKGWAIPEWVELTGKDVTEVHLCGVCACKWRRERCVGQKKCDLVGSEGFHRQTQILRDSMGDKFPKIWGKHDLFSSDQSEYCLREAAIKKLEEKYFKKCVPVEVGFSIRVGRICRR